MLSMLSEETQEIRDARRTQVGFDRQLLASSRQLTVCPIEPMNPKNNTCVTTVRIDSRTRTKQNGIKIRCMFVDTLGHAPH